MRIAVFGTGSVGGYFGGRLAQAGQQVSFIARGEHLRALQTDGLRVESPKGDFHLNPVQATDDPASVGPVDAVLVCVKAWQVPHTAHAIRPLMDAGTFVVPLQNGVEAPEQLAAVLGREAVLGGLCRIASMIAAPGHIRHLGIEPYIAFGEVDGRPSQRAARLQEAFTRAEVWAEVSPDIRAAMWEKFLFIASISGVGAVTRTPVGVFRDLPQTRRLLEQALAEVAEVARAQAVNLAEDIVPRTLSFIDGLPGHTTASMQRDIMEGRPSELSAQNGSVVRLGDEKGVTTPVHDFLYASLLPQEMLARGEIPFEAFNNG
jgi:2-dehydropantoate 2-reductase